ncbi:MAG: MarR family transcriptional regulator [Bacteroidetes bacterium]|jgi:DNA-binding MarR family transcriptional regulator|nr:MarR family transcriptional regulator [Bacteroidota bacterium]
MKTKNLLIELIEHLNRYEEEALLQNPNAVLNMSDFVGFLNSNYEVRNVKTHELRGNHEGYEFKEQKGPATDISLLIVLLFRYAKGYIKKALKDSVIKTADEFSFLITLITYESLSKTELIQKQIMEKTSGIEIINRLLKFGLIEQFNDVEDKRSIRVRVTPAGRIELMKILPQMQTVSQVVSGNLTETEKTTLAYMLRKLENFHNHIFMNKKDSSLEDLIE